MTADDLSMVTGLGSQVFWLQSPVLSSTPYCLPCGCLFVGEQSLPATAVMFWASLSGCGWDRLRGHGGALGSLRLECPSSLHFEAASLYP